MAHIGRGLEAFARWLGVAWFGVSLRLGVALALRLGSPRPRRLVVVLFEQDQELPLERLPLGGIVVVVIVVDRLGLLIRAGHGNIPSTSKGMSGPAVRRSGSLGTVKEHGKE